MKLKRIAPWLLPTLLAPTLGACLYVLLVSRAVDLPIPVPRFVWIIAAAAASGLSLFVGACMVAADLTLLKLELRMPPTGWRAWLMGALAPIPVLFTWQKLIRFAITGVWQFLLSFLLPMLVIAVVMRLLLGTRPTHWNDKANK
jgi:hypothetical protein